MSYEYLATSRADGGYFFAKKIAEFQPLGAHDVQIAVHAAGVNRADIYQAEGAYAPPTGASDVLGLEVSGIITAIGAEVRSLKVGDAVCALLLGGGYASHVQVAEWRVLPIPSGLTMEQAACLPEALFTSYLALLELGQLAPQQRVLIHGGASGVGVMAIQLTRAFGAQVVTTVGSVEKVALCEHLGAHMAINYKSQDFVAVIKDTIGGVDLVLDMVGGDYIEKNLRALNVGGRLVQLAFIQGARAEVNFASVLMKNLQIMGVTLRSQPEERIYALAQSLRNTVWPWLESGQIKTVIDSVIPLNDALTAHQRMRDFQHAGKIVLSVG